ncbi:MAG: SRPBCC family protein, partial [Chloroflexota bacterium]
GSDVNLIHRLLKNHVAEETGFSAYTLFTDAAVKNMGLEEASAAMTPMTEEYDHLGQVQIWVQDMRPVWIDKRESTRVPFPEERIISQASVDVGMSPEQVWDYLATPEHRSVLIGSDRQDVIDRKNGRIGPGSTYQCYHGDRIIMNIILEWRPFERILTQDLAETPIGDLYVVAEYRLEPTESGTRLTKSISHASGPLLARMIFNTVVRLTKKQSQQAIDHFRDHIEADLSARGPAALDEEE